MPVLDLIRDRGSIRLYKDKQIPESDLLKVLEAARLAPSAANRQPWQFIIVTDKKIKDQVADIAHLPERPRQNSILTAPAVIICLSDPAVSAIVGSLNGFQIDLALAVENMILTAWDLGIGSCCIGAFKEDDIKKLLGIPQNLRVVCLLTLGYADESPRPKNRKSLNEIIYYEMYGRKTTS